MEVFGVQFLQGFVAVTSVAMMLLGATAILLMLGIATAENSAAATVMHRTPALAIARAEKIRPSDVLLSSLPARAPPLIALRSVSPPPSALALE